MEEGDNMDQEKEIITFEELFKGEKKQTSNRPPENNKRGYTYSLLFYALIMYVVATIIALIMFEMPSMTKLWYEEELIFEQVANSPGGIAFVSDDTWFNYGDDYLDSVQNVGVYEGFIIIINKENQSYQTVLYDDEILTEQVIDEEKILDIISRDAVVTTWDNDTDIVIFQGRNLPRLTSLTNDTVLVTGPVKNITAEASSILNFLIYLIMVPGIIYFMKNDIIIDWNETKAKKKEIVVPVIIGYAYVWVGNFVSTLLSTYLADILNYGVGEAANQQAIISAVTSKTGFLMIISAVIIGPVIEELIFRKAVFGLIKNNKIALVVSTFVFGLIHVLSETSIQAAIVNGVSYFVMGFVFSYIYLKAERNVMIPIIVHIINNAVSILLILLIL